MYQDIPAPNGTLFQLQPSESDSLSCSLSSSNDVSENDSVVDVLVEGNGGSSTPHSSIPGQR